LESFKFIVVGFDKKKSTECEGKIRELGGEVVDKKTSSKKIAVVVATEGFF